MKLYQSLELNGCPLLVKTSGHCFEGIQLCQAGSGNLSSGSREHLEQEEVPGEAIYNE